MSEYIKTIVFPLINYENLNGHIYDYSNLKNVYDIYNKKDRKFIFKNSDYMYENICGIHSNIEFENGYFYTYIKMNKEFTKFDFLNLDNLTKKTLKTLKGCMVVSTIKTGNVLSNSKVDVHNVNGLCVDKLENVCPKIFLNDLRVKRIKSMIKSFV